MLILPKLPIYSEIKAKIEFCAKKFQISEFHFFFLLKEGNGISNIYCKFQDHSMKIFFKKSDF